MSPIDYDIAVLEIRNYLTVNGRDVFTQWYTELKDHRVRRAIDRRLNRLALGHFGDCKPCGNGVWELRIDLGPGYRLYYAQAGQTLVLLLCGGDKHTQQADIIQAKGYWQDWQNRPSR